MTFRPALFGRSLLLAGLLLPASLLAQSPRLSGIVRAASGAPVAAAQITFRSDGSPAPSAQAVTDATGGFALRLAGAADGYVVARADGFLPDSVRVLAREGDRTLAIVLRPLASLGVVTVVAPRPRPLLNTADAATGGTVERRELERLPTDARDPIALANTIPGVTSATGFFGDAPRLSINGANALYTQYSLDGLENNEGFLGGARVEVPLSALQRFSVLANTYGAEYGRSSNGVVNMETRAGGARWEGEAFVYNRPGLPVDARTAVVPSGQDPDDFRRAQEGFRRTQVGAAGGGPLRTDRTFVFGALEYTNENEDRIASTANATFTGREVRGTIKGFGRLDHGWSPTQTTTLRIAGSRVDREGRGSGIVAPEADIVTQRIGTVSALIHRSALREGRASNEFAAQLGTFRWNFPPAQSSFDIPQVTIRRVQGIDTVSVGVVGSSNFVFDEAETQLQLRNVFETLLGDRHRLRIGGDVSRSKFRLTGSQTNPSGSYVVLDEGNIPQRGNRYAFADVPSNVRVLSYTVDAAQKQVDLSQTLFGAFIEDRWRLSPALMLTLGLRWDYDDLTSRGNSSADLDNWQPRASVNWLAGRNTVLRAGAGLYAGKLPYTVYSDAIQFGPDGNQTVTFDGANAPAFLAGPRTATLDRSQLPPGEVRELFALGLEQPMSRQFSVGWQQQVGDRLAVGVDVVYTDTRNLPRSWDLNPNTRGIGPGDTISLPVTEGDRFRPVPPVTGSFRRRTTTESGGRATYAGLYTTARWTAGDDWLVDANWIWSRARTNTEDINFNATQGNDFDAEWADAINDRRHRVAARATWRGVRRLALSGIVDWQTGQPINRVAFFRDLDGSGDTFGNGFLGNQDRFFGVPRNGERLPSALFTSASVSYELRVRSQAVELRVDAFNLLNSTTVSGYANGLPGGGARTQVGRPGDPIVTSAVAPPRQLQFSARWLF
jgi:outer membrane receptor protein involved in Fe transport